MTPAGPALNRRDSTRARCASDALASSAVDTGAGKEHKCYAERKQTVSAVCEREGEHPSRIVKETAQWPYLQLCLTHTTSWHSHEQKDVLCKLIGQHDIAVGGVSFVIEDDEQLAFGSIPCAIFQSATDGTVMVPVTNQSSLGMTVEFGEILLQVRALEKHDIVAVDAKANQHVVASARQQLSDSEKEILSMAQTKPQGGIQVVSHPPRPTSDSGQLGDERPFAGKGETTTTAARELEATQASHEHASAGADISEVYAASAAPRCIHKQHGRGILPEKHNASLADVLSGKYTVCSIAPEVFRRKDVIPVVVLYGGSGGLEKGLPVKKDGKFYIVAVSIEGKASTVQCHKLNNPHIPCLQLWMTNHEQVLEAVEPFLPRDTWTKSWWHASPSCKAGSQANFTSTARDLENWGQTAEWTVGLLKKSRAAVWTLENTPRLLRRFVGLPTARIFRMERHCQLPQKRARLIVSNIVIDLPLYQGRQLSCFDALAERRGWTGPAASLRQRNSYAHVRSCDKPAFTVTS